MADVPWGEIAKYGVGMLGSQQANSVTQNAYKQILENLKARFGDYESIPPAVYRDVVAQVLGPSALSGIEADPGARQDQQESIAALDNIAKSGGLTLADMKVLNDVERSLNQQNASRQKGIANQFAARGQLGAGAQLGMQLDSAQNAAENANQRGESVAAQAQERAMKAILEKGSLSRNMSNDDYSRKARAAEAEDSIRKYNASMSTDAQKYNNGIRGQAFDDEMKRLGGKHGVTRETNAALLGSGQQNANTIAGQTSATKGLINSISSTGRTTGDGGYTPPPMVNADGSNPDEWNSFPSADERGDRGGPADLGNDEDEP